MAKSKEPHFTVIKDTREQKGHHFDEDAKNRCAGMVVQTMKTGDYTLLGFEDKLCIERKASVEELSINLGKESRPFRREIDRMAEFPHRFLILEFDLEDIMEFPNHKTSRIPMAKRKTVTISGKYILKCLAEFQLHYNIHVVFCGNKSRAFSNIMNIFKRINEMYV